MVSQHSCVVPWGHRPIRRWKLWGVRGSSEGVCAAPRGPELRLGVGGVTRNHLSFSLCLALIFSGPWGLGCPSWTGLCTCSPSCWEDSSARPLPVVSSLHSHLHGAPLLLHFPTWSTASPASAPVVRRSGWVMAANFPPSLSRGIEDTYFTGLL